MWFPFSVMAMSTSLLSSLLLTRSTSPLSSSLSIIPVMEGWESIVSAQNLFMGEVPFSRSTLRMRSSAAVRSSRMRFFSASRWIRFQLFSIERQRSTSSTGPSASPAFAFFAVTA